MNYEYYYYTTVFSIIAVPLIFSIVFFLVPVIEKYTKENKLFKIIKRISLAILIIFLTYKLTYNFQNDVKHNLFDILTTWCNYSTNFSYELKGNKSIWSIKYDDKKIVSIDDNYNLNEIINCMYLGLNYSLKNKKNINSTFANSIKKFIDMIYKTNKKIKFDQHIYELIKIKGRDDD